MLMSALPSTIGVSCGSCASGSLDVTLITSVTQRTPGVPAADQLPVVCQLADAVIAAQECV